MRFPSRPTLFIALPLPPQLASQATSLHISAPAMYSFHEQLTSSDPERSGQLVAQLDGEWLSITHATKGGLPIWRPSLLSEPDAFNSRRWQNWAGHWALISSDHVPPQAALVMWLRRNPFVRHCTSPLMLVRLQVQKGRMHAEASRITDGRIDPVPLAIIGSLSRGNQPPGAGD